MSLNMDQKRRLLESIEYIDDAMISDTMSRVNTDAVTAGMPSKGKRHVIWVKQVAVLAACALLFGAIIPVMTFVSKNVDLFSGFGAGADPGVEETEPLSEVVETEPPEPEVVPDEHGSEGLRYMINEDGTTASFIGWGDFKGKTAYIGSVYEGLPVTLVEAQASGLPIFKSNNVPNQCIMTPNVCSISLDKEAHHWAKEILSTYNNLKRSDTSSYIIKSGYDINSNAKWLQDFYLKEVNHHE